MNTIKTSERINGDRRRFFGTAAMTIAAAQFALNGSVQAQSGKAKPPDLPKIKPGTHTSFASLKQTDAGLLNVGYAEAGPANGPAVILLHGWPYDIHSQAVPWPEITEGIVAEMATNGGLLQSGERSLHSQMCALRVELAESLRPPPRIFPFSAD
jgi:hypothetical protein